MNTAKCPHCAVWLAVPDECLGVRDRCPGCGGRFRVVANTEEVLVETIDFPDEWLRVPAAGARVDEPLTAELVDEPHAAVPRSPAPRANESEPAATQSEPSATPNTRTAGPWQRGFAGDRAV